MAQRPLWPSSPALGSNGWCPMSSCDASLWRGPLWRGAPDGGAAARRDGAIRGDLPDNFCRLDAMTPAAGRDDMSRSTDSFRHTVDRHARGARRPHTRTAAPFRRSALPHPAASGHERSDRRGRAQRCVADPRTPGRLGEATPGLRLFLLLAPRAEGSGRQEDAARERACVGAFPVRISDGSGECMGCVPSRGVDFHGGDKKSTPPRLPRVLRPHCATSVSERSGRCTDEQVWG
jgi:hypothetical protein